MFELKSYQQKVLDSLRIYLRGCNEEGDADIAFYEVSHLLWGRGIPYRAIKEPSELADIPYVCLRLPTGGGKTLLGCHAISIVNKELLQKDNSLVLWLVPSNAIKEQTINALRDPNHAYRQALESTLGNVTIMDTTEALYLQRGVLAGSTVIIVSTLHAFRVEDKEGRRVYSSAGALQHHFQNLPKEIQDKLEHDEKGVISYSLANVMRIHRPLVIVDEAHNARTELSFDMLARFKPSAIVEFTATPDSRKNPSNVLHSVSAAELKAEYMIKLPIRLESQTDWQALLSDAIAQRAELEKKALIERKKTGDYIRPMMLIQAQPRRQGHETLSVETIEKSLIEDHHIPENQIVRATGEDRGLEGINLNDEKCEIRFVITVQALREGWDCPFAYVLCSLAEQRSAGAVEQILGRILRLPYCKPRDQKELNLAYAFVASPNFAEAANSLVDALIENGFERQEAQEFIKPVETQPGFGFSESQRKLHTKTIFLKQVPDLKQVSPGILGKIEIDETKNTITLKACLTLREEEEIIKQFKSPHDKQLWSNVVKSHRAETVEIFKSPSERGLLFEIPVLSIRRERELELFEEDHLLDRAWGLADADAKLTADELEKLKGEGGQFGEIDIGSGGKIKSKFIPELNKELSFTAAVDHWTDTQLIFWLDLNLDFIDLSSDEKSVYLTALVGDLMDRRGMELSQLVRKKFELRKMIETKIKKYREEARKKAYQELLFGDLASEVIVSPQKCFTFQPDQYPHRYVCPRSESFGKHYYPKVGELDGEGEEFLCAQYLDQMDEVAFWVRNLERQDRFSFWLQTPTDKFYPDFVCKLKDGRYLVIEYKGADRWSNDDSKEKRRLGELWQMKSGGKCLFVMPQGKDWAAIRAALK